MSTAEGQWIEEPAFAPAPEPPPSTYPFSPMPAPAPSEPPPKPPSDYTPLHKQRGWRLVASLVALAVGVLLGRYLGPGRWLFDNDDGSSKQIVVQSLTDESTSSDSVSSNTAVGVPFTDPERYFSVTFPSTPDPEQFPHPEPDRPPYTVWAAGNVGVARLFLDATFHPDPQEFGRTTAERTGGTLRSVMPSEDPDGHPTADFVIDDSDGSALYGHIVIADAELFILEALEPAGSSDGLADLMKLEVDFRILR